VLKGKEGYECLTRKLLRPGERGLKGFKGGKHRKSVKALTRNVTPAQKEKNHKKQTLSPVSTLGPNPKKNKGEGEKNHSSRHGGDESVC